MRIFPTIRFSKLRPFTWLLLLLICAQPALSQSALDSLTPEQRRILSQLPESQRQALLEKFLGGRAPASRVDPVDTTQITPIDDLNTDKELTEDEDKDQVLEVGDTLVIIFPEALSEVEPDEDELEFFERVLNGNPYKIEKDGNLNLPGIAALGLAGLTAEQAKIRLQADSYFNSIELEIHILPLDDLSGRSLRPFGYELFRGRSKRFSSGTNVPVPTDYLVGPGDVVSLQLYGNANASYELEVDRNGVLSLPELGPVTVAGLSFDSLRKDVERRVEEQMIGTQASITLTQLRSIQVVLVGDVQNPGSYTVSAMSTMIDVLLLGGGISENGSLRRIELKRRGRTISQLDLYNLLLSGNSTGNRRVTNGDVVFVPPLGSSVTVSGSVNRPAGYEFTSNLDAGEALKLAGGASADAFLAGATIERNDPANGLTVLDINLGVDSGRSTAIQDGDILIVPGATEQVDNAVRIVGSVDRPGIFQWRSGLRLSDVLKSTRDLKPEADTQYVLIKREQIPNGPISVFSSNLLAIWKKSPEAEDPILMSRDVIYVVPKGVGRRLYIEPILRTLRAQGSSDQPSAIVTVGGRVKFEGAYPLEKDMTVADLLRAGGGLAESAYQEFAELTRYAVSDLKSRTSELINIELSKILVGDSTSNIRLKPFDYLNIKEISRWKEADIVEIGGEVKFPGKYPVFQGETLSTVLKRAGGLTEFAFPEGSIFTRERLKEKEREQLDVLASRVEGDLSSLALSDPGQTEAINIGQSLLQQLEDSEPTGRLVIDLESILKDTRKSDIFLRDGDELIVPSVSQEVTVLGEVQYATSHLWASGLNRDDYIDRSGGITVKADKQRIYVVRANGEVVVSNRSRFFSRTRGFDIRPGDTIVVPLDTDRVKPLVLWSSATQIVYNLAIAAAAVNSF